MRYRRSIEEMATSQQRELMAQIEQLGYTYKGHDRQNAVIMWHPEAGAIRLHATSSDNRYAMNKVREARRRIRQTQSRYGKFVDWLMQEHRVGRTDQKDLRLNVRDEARQYVQTHPDAGRLESLVAQVDQDERVEVLERHQGQKTWLVRLTGPDYGLENLLPEDDTPHVSESRVTANQADNQTPMNTVLEQLRSMMVAEMNGELEDLRAKQELTVSTLTDLLAALQEPARVPQ